MQLDTVDRDRSALVFIEFQREWVDPEGTLRRLLVKDEERFRGAVENAARMLEGARRNGWTVVHAGLNMRSDPQYRLFNQGRGVLGLRRAIPGAGTWTGRGADFAEPFVPLPGEFVVEGRSGASVLKNSTLDPFLRNADINTMFLAGFATHVCVESSLREAHDTGYNAYMVDDACAAFEAVQHDHVREHVVHHFGALTTTSELLGRMEA